jgi:RNA-directed DNA polymerase
MMHGTEQSDSSIVLRKPVNKAAQAAAEPAEGSGGTKRNADFQSTVRTRSREAVSQAQGRIRDAVNRNKKERLTALASASRQHRLPPAGFLQTEEAGCAGRG